MKRQATFIQNNGQAHKPPRVTQTKERSDFENWMINSN
jgi:hypothetical protein